LLDVVVVEGVEAAAMRSEKDNCDTPKVTRGSCVPIFPA
jgi:hypothetical protein